MAKRLFGRIVLVHHSPWSRLSHPFNFRFGLVATLLGILSTACGHSSALSPKAQLSQDASAEAHAKTAEPEELDWNFGASGFQLPPSHDCKQKPSRYLARFEEEFLHSKLNTQQKLVFQECLELQGEYESARRILSEGLDSLEFKGSLRELAELRQVRLDLYVQDWRSAAIHSAAWLNDDPTTGSEKIVLASAAAAMQTLLEANYESAPRYLLPGRRVIDRLRLAEYRELPVDAVPWYFASGERHRLLSEQILLQVPLSQFSEVLERRCEHIIAAQSDYAEVMRGRNVRWSITAAMQMASLYTSLHRELMILPPPRQLKADDLVVFHAAMALRYHILLKKGELVLLQAITLSETSNRDEGVLEVAKFRLDELKQAAVESEELIEGAPMRREDLAEAMNMIARSNRAIEVDPYAQSRATSSAQTRRMKVAPY